MQVIVKYAAIELTPEHPEFSGGAWHVEGMRAESIVASAVAYLRCENITASLLEFRSMVEAPTGEDPEIKRIFGFSDGDALNDHLGAVTCSEGRVVAFPNVLRHRLKV